jgi:hypothetical protein
LLPPGTYVIICIKEGQDVPVILRVKGYRFWFYGADLDEPPHVHVGKDGKEAKYWVDSIALARAVGFRQQELSEIERILADYRTYVLEVWRKEQRKRANR